MAPGRARLGPMRGSTEFMKTFRVNLRRTTVHYAIVTVQAEDDVDAEGVAGDLGLAGDIKWQNDSRGPGFDVDVIDVEEVET